MHLILSVQRRNVHLFLHNFKHKVKLPAVFPLQFTFLMFRTEIHTRTVSLIAELSALIIRTSKLRISGVIFSSSVVRMGRVTGGVNCSKFQFQLLLFQF